ncbi:hypothetical protein HBA_0601 [Sodalis endosymbiont of Henestaris halophilus]|nr:hypothetical protein HBA_0601 [Sodalis endosymbiont of Henestaris halophilus]
MIVAYAMLASNILNIKFMFLSCEGVNIEVTFAGTAQSCGLVSTKTSNFTSLFIAYKTMIRSAVISYKIDYYSNSFFFDNVFVVYVSWHLFCFQCLKTTPRHTIIPALT